MTSCKKQEKMDIEDIDNIKNIKWISDANYEYSPWNSKIMPTILDFRDSLVALNFSNTFIDYKLVDNKLYLNGSHRFNISDFNSTELFLESEGTTKRYIPLKKGLFHEDDKINFEQIIQSKHWLFNDEKTQFKDFMISIYSENQDFVKGGIYAIFLYNQNLIITLNIDGSKERELYFVKEFDQNIIKLNKLNSDDAFNEVIVRG
jgi:hypothetical protein